MKFFNKPHPFKIYITNNTVFVNAGQVYCYYNPLNFKFVRLNYNKPVLKKMPFSLNEEAVGIEIPEDMIAINVNLFASLLPPKKWVPANFYIPVIDRAWIVLTCFKEDKEDGSSVIIGQTKNLRKDNIKYEIFDPKKPQPSAQEKKAYENKINKFGNAWNLCLLGQAELIDEKWQITQCVNNHFPITPLRNTWSYLTSNTEIYNGNISSESEENNLLKNPLITSFFERDVLNLPDITTHRGYISYTDMKNIITTKWGQIKVPSSSISDKESLYPNNYEFFDKENPNKVQPFNYSE